jgi:hypothetical protein
MAGIVMKKGFTEKARKKAFESIFKKFDHNHNGKNICTLSENQPWSPRRKMRNIDFITLFSSVNYINMYR